MYSRTHQAAEVFLLTLSDESIDRIVEFIEDDKSRCLIREVLERMVTIISKGRSYRSDNNPEAWRVSDIRQYLSNMGVSE